MMHCEKRIIAERCIEKKKLDYFIKNQVCNCDSSLLNEESAALKEDWKVFLNKIVVSGFSIHDKHKEILVFEQ